MVAIDISFKAGQFDFWGSIFISVLWLSVTRLSPWVQFCTPMSLFKEGYQIRAY
jgi:hypothetical protein